MAKRKRRNFTPEFKAEVVLEALRGESSQAELCQRHNISEDQVSKWKQQFLENAATLFESGDRGSQGAAERIAHLEQLVGRLTVELDIHKKAKAWLSEKVNLNAQGRKDSPE
ncbi:MAG: transposase [Candidatus Poribacteria bacterium]|nr:transposase [Candidatus Poribacteria bacterium]